MPPRTDACGPAGRAGHAAQSGVREQLVFALDRDLRYTSFNSAHAALMHELHGVEIALGDRLPDHLTVEADRRGVRANLERALAGERIVASVASGEPGRERYFDVVFEPLTDAAGSVVGLAVRAAEVSDLRRAENWMQRSEERYRLLFENMLEGFAYCRMHYDDADRPDDFIYLSVNPAFARLTGLEDVVGKRVTEVIPRVKDETPELLKLYGKVARTGEPAEFEIDFTPLGLWLHVSAFRPEPDHFVAVFADVTTTKVAEKAAAEARRLLEEAQAISKLGGWQYDVERDEVSWTEEVYRIHGLGSEFDPRDYRGDIGFYAPQSAPLVAEAFRRAVESGEPYDLEVELDRADGERIWVRTVGHPLVVDGVVVRVIGNIMDVTERRRAEAALRESEARLRFLIDQTPTVTWMLNRELRFTLSRGGGLKALGLEPDQVVGMYVGDYLGGAGAQADLGVVMHERALAGETLIYEQPVGDLVFDVILGPLSAAGGTIDGVIGVGYDATERLRAQQALRESEERFAALFHEAPLGYQSLDEEGRLLDVNAAWVETLGYERAQVIGKWFGDFLAPEQVQAFRERFPILKERGAIHSEFEMVRKNGERRTIAFEGRMGRDSAGGFRQTHCILTDVTARRRAEEQLRADAAALEAAAAEWRQTFDTMRDSVAVFDAESRVVRCNLATTVLTGRAFAEIIGRPCHEVFHGGTEYPAMCPQRSALVSGKVETGFLEQTGRWLRVTFQPLHDVAGELTGGVHVVSDVTELRQAERRLQESLLAQQRISEGMIAALARSVEVRDPYTAGHERRVSELAEALARELGADAETARRVRIAGMLHDIGKITVPAEILAKPGRLTETEFRLIKGHSEAAHEILEPIEFGFPLGAIVLQHHERLDGSGYPAGLTADEILPEARILAVADVVEAMISHRPYRAALPLAAAMAELEGGAGRRYDAAVCAAAIRLFREQGFAFTD